MSTQIIQSAASEALVNVTLAAITLLAAIAMYYIRLAASKVKTQTAKIKDEAGRKTLENALDDVSRLATLAVNYTEQTVAKALREAVKAGNGDRDRLVALGREVFIEVKREISPEVQRVITDNLGNFDHYLEATLIGKTVDEAKAMKEDYLKAYAERMVLTRGRVSAEYRKNVCMNLLGDFLTKIGI